MENDVRILFREVADLSPSQREQHYSRRCISALAQAELESLLRFDATAGDSLGDVVPSVALRFLRFPLFIP